MTSWRTLVAQIKLSDLEQTLNAEGIGTQRERLNELLPGRNLETLLEDGSCWRRSPTDLIPRR